jgi:hypothetical protein
LNRVLTDALQFHHADPRDLDEMTLRRYRLMHDAYFEERALIPDGRLHELPFEELERDPIGQLHSTYGALGLSGFDAVLPAMEDHVARLSGYRKNEYPDLPLPMRDRILQEWRRPFAAWGYSTDAVLA